MFRVVLAIFIGLAAAATIVLYLLPGMTDQFFAWTIASPLTATMLGASYAGALAMFTGAIRERPWANARVAVIAPFVLSTTILVATVLHLDKFHLSGAPIPVFVGWLWLIVYIVVPPALLLVWFASSRRPGVDPPRSRPIPRPLKLVIAVLALGLCVVGAILLVAPDSIEPGWPWPLTPLTGRVIGCWLLGTAAGLSHAVVEDDLVRVRPGTAGLAVIGLLGVGAIVRYGGEIRWGLPSAWMLLAVLAIYLVVGSAGYAMGLGREPARLRAA